MIFANPDACGGNDSLLISTLAHELGHAIYDAPAWILAAQMGPLPGLLAPARGRQFKTVTPHEGHLTAGEKKPKASPDFQEWRANEFMGSLLVPRDKLIMALRDVAMVMRVPLGHRPSPAALVPGASQMETHVAPYLTHRDWKLRTMIKALAEDFGVSRRFIEVRLLRYGLITQAQLGPA